MIVVKILCGLFLILFAIAMPVAFFFDNDPTVLQPELSFICSLISSIFFSAYGVAIIISSKKGT